MNVTDDNWIYQSTRTTKQSQKTCSVKCVGVDSDCAGCKYVDGVFWDGCCPRKLDESARNNGWVSVKDRPPEPYDEVLFVLIRRDGSAEVNAGFLRKDGRVSLWRYGNKFDLERVTHWMPMPKPPSQQKGTEA